MVETEFGIGTGRCHYVCGPDPAANRRIWRLSFAVRAPSSNPGSTRLCMSIIDVIGPAEDNADQLSALRLKGTILQSCVTHSRSISTDTERCSMVMETTILHSLFFFRRRPSKPSSEPLLTRMR
jgi:hypothetical protein